MATTLLLVRHAAHPLLGRVLCGRMPSVALDEAGMAQAGRLGRALADRQPTAIYTSPIARAQQTAAYLADACGTMPCTMDALQEIDFGRWTGRSFAELAADPAWSAWNQSRATARPPAGESMQEAQVRVVGGLQALRAAHGDALVVAVSHADVIKATILWVLGLTLDAHQRFDIDPASVSTVVLWDGGAKLLSLNVDMAT